MTPDPRRRVTRGYVGGLVFAVLIAATALLVAGWGGLSLLLGREPVSNDSVPLWVGPLAVLLALGALGLGLWQQALLLLRGRFAPPWGHTISLAGGAYLLWCLIGLLAGLETGDTWVSPFAACLAAVWAIASLLFWAVLARRVYTDRPAPRWPWERREDRERDQHEEEDGK